MRDLWQLLLGFVILAICALLAWIVFGTMFGLILQLDKTIIPAAITALVGILSLLFVTWRDRVKSRSEAHREKKIEVYGIFLDLIFEVLRQSKNGIDPSDYLVSSAFEDKFFALMRGATFYGSPNVILALAKWKTSSNSDDSLHAIKMVGSVLLAMRKDIGLSNFGIDNLTIHQTYVRDDIRDMSKVGATS